MSSSIIQHSSASRRWVSTLSISIPCNSGISIDRPETQLEVATSSNQLKLSVPLVAPKGRMQIEPFKDLTRSESTEYGRIDDLDNIDALLEEIIDDDLWEDEE